jgi:hypothetical protein
MDVLIQFDFLRIFYPLHIVLLIPLSSYYRLLFLMFQYFLFSKVLKTNKLQKFYFFFTFPFSSINVVDVLYGFINFG